MGNFPITVFCANQLKAHYNEIFKYERHDCTEHKTEPSQCDKLLMLVLVMVSNWIVFFFPSGSSSSNQNE